MTTRNTRKFHGMCDQFRWVAMIVAFGGGALIVLVPLVLPHGYKLEGVIVSLPAICYLFGVWSIGQAMGQVAKGRLIEAALPSALRRVGLSLVVGVLINTFVVAGLYRLAGGVPHGYVRLDAAGVTLGIIGAALYLLGRIVDQALAAQAELDEMI